MLTIGLPAITVTVFQGKTTLCKIRLEHKPTKVSYDANSTNFKISFKLKLDS